MGIVWSKAARLRPDPYLDWEARLAGPSGEARWCPIEIDLKPAPGTDGTLEVHYLPSLWRLVASVGPVPDGAPVPAPLADTVCTQFEYIWMSSWLTTLDIQRDSGAKVPFRPGAFRFFLYRPEALVYSGGAYADTDLFTTVSAGPPIAGFHPTRNTERGAGAGPVWTNLDPRPVAIGIIDDGLAFAHARFRTDTAKGQKTRIKSIWLQDIAAGGKDKSVVIGQVLEKGAINALIARHGDDDAAIYRAVGLNNHGRTMHKPLAFRRGHGTFCLDLAAGADPSDRVADRPIFAVQLPPEAVADVSGATVGSYVLQGVRHIMQAADFHASGIPLILNFSYGILAGPKDGTHPLERALDEMVAERKARTGGETRIVMSAGNSRLLRANAVMTLDAGAANTIEWLISPDDRTANFVEIWLDGLHLTSEPDDVRLTLVPPGGSHAHTLSLGSDRVHLLQDGSTLIAAMTAQRGLGAEGKRVRVLLAVGPTTRMHDTANTLAPAGRWRITMTNTGGGPVDARLYIQRDGTPAGYPFKGRTSRFDHTQAYERDPVSRNFSHPATTCPIRRDDSLSAIATGTTSIIVGAMSTDEGPQGVIPSRYSSTGPTRNSKTIAHSAIADFGGVGGGMVAAGTLSGSWVIMNGTSVAAPQVVRALADAIAAVPSPNRGPLPSEPDGAIKLTDGASFLPASDKATALRRRYGTSVQSSRASSKRTVS
mgnify:CR=1 FL=1